MFACTDHILTSSRSALLELLNEEKAIIVGRLQNLINLKLDILIRNLSSCDFDINLSYGLN